MTIQTTLPPSVARWTPVAGTPRPEVPPHHVVLGITDRRGMLAAIEQLRGFSRPERIAVLSVHTEAQGSLGAGRAPGNVRVVVAELLRASVRATDVVAWLDDDHYGVVGSGVMPGVEPGLPNRIRLAIIGSPRLTGTEVAVGFVTMVAGESSAEALARAEAAMAADRSVRTRRRETAAARGTEPQHT